MTGSRLTGYVKPGVYLQGYLLPFGWLDAYLRFITGDG